MKKATGGKRTQERYTMKDTPDQISRKVPAITEAGLDSMGKPERCPKVQIQVESEGDLGIVPDLDSSKREAHKRSDPEILEDENYDLGSENSDSEDRGSGEDAVVHDIAAQLSKLLMSASSPKYRSAMPARARPGKKFVQKYLTGLFATFYGGFTLRMQDWGVSSCSREFRDYLSRETM